MKSSFITRALVKNAENISTKILNLPTGSYVDEGEVVKVCELIKLFLRRIVMKTKIKK
jgi:dTDP-4-amino-4,6-dideoxygalactose transaminase